MIEEAHHQYPITMKCYKRCRYIQPPKREMIKPCPQYKPSNSPMDPLTVYKKSYLNFEPWMILNSRPPKFIPEHNLKPLSDNLDSNTITHLSYPGHFSVPPPKPIKPFSSQLLGKGPMQDCTTQKHDYVRKPFSKPNQILKQSNLKTSDAPLDHLTTNSLSYMKPELQFTKPIRPQLSHKKSDAPMESNTTQKLSFLPYRVPPKEIYPWALKAKYQPPTKPFEKCTIQKLSFIPPGHFVEDPELCCEEISNACENLCENKYPRAGIYK